MTDKKEVEDEPKRQKQQHQEQKERKDGGQGAKPGQTDQTQSRHRTQRESLKSGTYLCSGAPFFPSLRGGNVMPLIPHRIHERIKPLIAL